MIPVSVRRRRELLQSTRDGTENLFRNREYDVRDYSANRAKDDAV